jgi:hypothetical protein
MATKARAPVPGALQRRSLGALPERLPQCRQREVELALDEPVHVQPPRGRVDVRNRAVRSHVERFRGRHGALDQSGKPGLGVERLLLVHDEVRSLSEAIHARSLRVTTTRAACAGHLTQPPAVARTAMSNPARATPGSPS